MRILATLERVYLEPEGLASTIAFYEALFGEPHGLRFPFPELGLELCKVGPLLLIAGSQASLEPLRRVRLTLLVDDLEAAQRHLEAHGATILDAIREVPTGWNLHVRHPDGTVAEYVQHRPR